MATKRERQKQAGRKGGATTKARHGAEHFSSIGRKGGAATKEQLGSEHFRAAGRRGGEAMAGRTADLRKAGLAGGKATLEKLGPEHLKQIAAFSVAERSARKLLPPLLAALAPFEGWLEAVRSTWLQLQGKATPEDGCTLHPASQGLTFGDCARLLQALRVAQGKAVAGGAVAGMEDLLTRFSKDFPPSSSERELAAPLVLGDAEEPVRELTVELEEGAVPAGGGE